MNTIEETKSSETIEYASGDLHVLPLHGAVDGECTCGKPECDSAGKHPISQLVPQGQKDATADPNTVCGWWEAYPDANVGIACTEASGLLVIDVDPRHGGDKSYDGLRAEYELPPTWTVRTGGGGWHLYFRHPGGAVRSALPGEYPGIDVKGNGYVVAPPSVHASGKAYEWEVHPDDAPLAEVPDWLFKLIEKPEGTEKTSQVVDGYAELGLTP